MSCRKTCLSYKTRRHEHGSYYSSGFKRCDECELFPKWSGAKCPSCNKMLKTKAHNTRLKAKLRNP